MGFWWVWEKLGCQKDLLSLWISRSLVMFMHALVSPFPRRFHVPLFLHKRNATDISLCDETDDGIYHWTSTIFGSLRVPIIQWGGLQYHKIWILTQWTRSSSRLKSHQEKVKPSSSLTSYMAKVGWLWFVCHDSRYRSKMSCKWLLISSCQFGSIPRST